MMSSHLLKPMAMSVLLLLLLLLMSQVHGQHGLDNRPRDHWSGSSVTHDRCEPISKINMCKGIPYNETIFPNLRGHDTQEEADQAMSGFYPLIKINCSADIQLFLCALYAPVCTMLNYPLPPCRALCLSAKRGCEEVMSQFDYPWPSYFDCNNFPVGGKPDELCVGNSQHTSFSDSDLERMKTSTYKPSRPGDIQMNFECPVQLQMPDDYEYKLYIGHDQVIENCGAPCYHNVTFFNKDQIHLAHNWIAGFSVVCLCSCIFTLATFFTNLNRFPYPERPFIYLALSFGVISVVFLVGFAFEEDISCNPPIENREMNFITEKTIRQGAVNDWKCTLSAMTYYYFLMAGSLWWTILTFSWWLSAFHKWSQEAIDAKSQIFHFVAWTVPSILTLTVVVLHKVEGDVLSGVCFVGLWDTNSLTYYVIIPLGILLGISTILLALGFLSLFKLRFMIKHDGKRTESLDKLMKRIGCFSSLYTTFALILLLCYVYEKTYMPDWQQMWQEEICRNPTFVSRWQIPCRYPDGQGPQSPEPHLAFFLLKYTAPLLIGITSGFWVWNVKTANTWRSCFFPSMNSKRDKTSAPTAYV